MGALDITAAECRYRLTSLTSTEISDTVLSSASMITAADAWANRLLTLNGTALANLSSDQSALLKAAKIAFVCKRIVTDANLEDFQAGPVSSKRATANEKAAMVEILRGEIKELLDLADLYLEKWDWTYTGGDDYHPTGEDNTNIDFANTDDDVEFDIFGGDSA